MTQPTAPRRALVWAVRAGLVLAMSFLIVLGAGLWLLWSVHPDAPPARTAEVLPAEPRPAPALTPLPQAEPQPAPAPAPPPPPALQARRDELATALARLRQDRAREAELAGEARGIAQALRQAEAGLEALGARTAQLRDEIGAIEVRRAGLRAIAGTIEQAVGAAPAPARPAPVATPEPALTITPPALPAPPPTIAAVTRRERVFVHHDADPASAERAAAVAESLRQQGFEVAALRTVPFRIARTQLRYFFAEDQAAAEDLYGWLAGWSRVHNLAVATAPGNFATFRPLPAMGTLEVWLATP